MADFPFIFFNHGSPLDVYSFQGEHYCVMWFAGEPKPKEQKQIEKLCPKPLKGLFSWGRSQFCGYVLLEEDSVWGYYSRKINMDMETLDFQDKKAIKAHEKQVFQAFADDIARWVEEVHNIFPLAFVVSIERITGSDWDKWSHTQGTTIFKIIEKFFKNTSNISHTEIFVVEKTLELIKEIPSETLDKAWILTIQKMIKELR